MIGLRPWAAAVALLPLGLCLILVGLLLIAHSDARVQRAYDSCPRIYSLTADQCGSNLPGIDEPEGVAGLLFVALGITALVVWPVVLLAAIRRSASDRRPPRSGT